MTSSFHILFSSSFTANQITQWKLDTTNHMLDPVQGKSDIIGNFILYSVMHM